MNYLSTDGLQRFFTGLKTVFAAKVHTHDVVTESSNGFMSTEDKTILDKLDDAATDYSNLVLEVQLLADDWSGSAPYSQTVSVSGMNADYNYGPMFAVPTGTQSTDEAAIEALSCISYATTATGSVTFYCYSEKPTSDVTVRAQRIVESFYGS